MKIFSKEEKQEVAYVQYDDLLTLYNSDVYIPESIYDQVFIDDFIVDNHNRFDFIKFSDNSAVEFLRCVDWIVNYEDLDKMNPYELYRYYLDTIIETKNLTNNKNFSPDDIEFEQGLLSYKAYSIKNFYLTKYSSLEMNFPILPNKVLIDDSNHSGLIVSRGINPSTVLLHKSNCEPFIGSDNVNNKLLNEGVSKVIDSETYFEKEIFEYTSKYGISDDYKYFVVKYRQPKNKYRRDAIDYQPTRRHKNKFDKILKKKLKKRNDKY